MSKLICIPSRNRVELIPQSRGVWRFFDNTEDMKVLVCASEEKAYAEYLSEDVIFPVADNKTIADKRQYALELAIRLNKTHLFIIDDDIILRYYDKTLPSKYRLNPDIFKQYHLDAMMNELQNICGEKYPIVGLPNKQASQDIKYTYEKNRPIIRFVCYHVPTLKKEGLQINKLGVPFMSDRYALLYMLSRGYRSLTVNKWCIDDLGTNKKGGCSETRTAELQSESAKRLLAEFPRYVELKHKNNGLWTEDRIDCTLRLAKTLDEEEVRMVPRNLIEEEFHVGNKANY